MAVSLLTLLHVLVLVYWLGGDLGAFYSSPFLRDANRSVAERMLALKILNGVDMAPRTALILALPTGFTLAWLKGWIDVPGYLPALVVVGGLVWLALAWIVHLRHLADGPIKRADIAIRYAVLVVLALTGVGGLLGVVALPLFIALKMIILASCIALGLLVRRQLGPLIVAVREMNRTGATPATDAAIDGVLAHTRRSVLAIWALVILAAFLGIATPV